MRVFLAEDLEYFLRVAVVLGKDYSLAQLLAVIDLQAVRHQQIQRQTYGVLVEQPLVESGGLYLIRQLAVFVGEGGLVLGLFVLGQLVVFVRVFLWPVLVQSIGQFVPLGSEPLA